MENNNKYAAEEIIRISGTNPIKCMKCGKCSGTCPSFHEMDIHPHQFVSMVQKGDVEGLLASRTVWQCLSCFACVERCPRGVEPAALIEAARTYSVRRQGMNHMNPDDIPAILDEDTPQQLLMSVMRKFRK